jgi:REP element-mobilizing transposase RayT
VAHPIIIAHHLIWTVYGWWLPNDPRGSGSREVAADILKPLGELHRGRKKIQPTGEDIRAFYADAESLLKFPLLKFGSSEIAAIARAVEATIEHYKYTCYGCAIMPDHVHILIRKHKYLAEEMMGHFRNAGRAAVVGSCEWPSEHPVFGGGEWKVFLDNPEEVRRTIRYIEENPGKGRIPSQEWNFVTAYNNWPLHEGHSENSPYARRLRERR